MASPASKDYAKLYPHIILTGNKQFVEHDGATFVREETPNGLIVEVRVDVRAPVAQPVSR